MSETTALAVAAPQTAAAWDGHLNQAQLDLFNRACHGATADEAKLLFQTAAAMGLNPVIGGYIHGVKRWDGRAKREVMQIQVGIGGYRLCALRTGQYEGRLGPEFCGEDGQWKASWPTDKPPVACRVGVKRKGFSETIWHVTHYREVVQLDKEGKPNRTWAKMPITMLAKCCEAQALRSAFPDMLSGTYAPEEMGEVETGAVGVHTAHQTEEGDYLPPLTPELLAARKKLLAVFSTSERCREWVKKITDGLDIEQLLLEDLEILTKRAEAIKAKQAQQSPLGGGAPAAPDRKAINKRLHFRSTELFGDDEAGRAMFAAWAHSRDLLTFSDTKGRRSIAESTDEQVLACLEALGHLTEEGVAEFAAEVEAEEEAAEAAFADQTAKQRHAALPEKELWD